MKDELKHKIQSVLDRRITNELQVVYLLVELRKLMDREQYKDSSLRMFCNWVVHTSLERRADGSTNVLREFDELMIEIHERKKERPQSIHASLGTFRRSLVLAFKRFGLSPRFLDTLAAWKKFFSFYAAIVSDCPIVFTASRTPLKYIERVELRGVTRGVLVKEWPVLSWRLTLRDGSTHNWGFQMG